MSMKKLDRFILSSFVGPFFLILLVVIFILLMQFLWVYIDELVGKGLGLGVIAEFLFWGSCTVLPLALPLATLLASVMTLGNMGENSELIALKAAGISVLRVMTPLLIASFFISVCTFFVINNLVPVAYNEIYTLRDDIGRTKDEIKIPVGTFYDGVEGYVLRIDGRDDRTGIMSDVMLYDHNVRGNTRLTLADSAEMRMSKDKTYLTFKMYNGINYQETNDKTYKDTTLQLQKVDFSRQEMVISLENYAFQKSDSARFGDQVKALPLESLRAQRDTLSDRRDSTKKAQFMATAASYIFKQRKQLDTVELNINSSFSDPEFMNFSNEKSTASALRKASEQAKQLSANIQSYEFGAYDYTVRLRRTKVEFLRRYGQALTCFIMFFIGAPLGALIRKGGLGVSAIIAILFFVFYWVIDITVVKLARDGSVSAVIAAFGASGVLLPIGIFLTRKAIHDTDLSNTDSIKNRWRKLKSAIAGFFKKDRIVFMGTPEFAVESLKALVENKYKVVGVVTVADKPSGRGQNVHESAVKKYAVSQGLPVLQPKNLKDPQFLEELKALKGDLFVVVAFRMLPEAVWTMPKLGTFNLHAALLPQYRGAAPINWAVINGEARTGVTTFMIDKNIDTGGIILRQSILLSDTDTAGDVHDKLMTMGAEMVVQTTQGIIEHNVETRVQRSFIQGSEVLKPAPKITRELCHIDWTDTTAQIYNLIRGLSPSPAAFTELMKEGGAAAQSAPVKLASVQSAPVQSPKEGGTADQSAPVQSPKEGSSPARPAPVQLKIYFGEKVGMDELSALGKDGTAPGSVISDGKSYLWIRTSDGAVSLKDVQLAGKKRMEIKAFLAGFRDPESYATTQGTSKAEIKKA